MLNDDLACKVKTSKDLVMEQSATNLIAKKVCWYQTTAILFVIALSWFDEILDIPYVLLGGPPTLINWRESVFESIIIALVGGLIIRHTYKLLVRVGYLESILPVCSSCKKMRVDPAFWRRVEKIVQEQASKDSTHGICPECISRYYPELAQKSESSDGGE